MKIKQRDAYVTANARKECYHVAHISVLEKMIIEMNKISKRNTSDEENPRYNVGGFKIVSNIIGAVNVINTNASKDVEKEIGKLLNEYNSKIDITLEDIIGFHFEFQRIHPFGDGNGRVDRIIIFKECLRNAISHL